MSPETFMELMVKSIPQNEGELLAEITMWKYSAPHLVYWKVLLKVGC